MIQPEQRVSIAAVLVGERRRNRPRKLRSLARSIEAHGLLHPILVRGHELIAGQRRLEACRLLGWESIPARDVSQCDDAELRAIELDENTERDDLDTYEVSKEKLAAIHQAEARLKAKATAVQDLIGTLPKKPRTTGKPPGRPKGTKKAASQIEVAKETGVSPRERKRKERHVEIAERFPFMQRDGWIQHHVLEAGALVDKHFTEAEHASLAMLLDDDGVPAKRAIAVLENLAAMDRTARKAIYTGIVSTDPHVRSNAQAAAAALPPLPDPALGHLSEARYALDKAVRHCRVRAFVPEITRVRGLVDTVLQQLIKETGAHPI